MRAQVGDQLVRQGRLTGLAEVVGAVIEVTSEDGSPPYVVKFYEDGTEQLVSPDPDRYWIREHGIKEHGIRGSEHPMSGDRGGRAD
ncbi:MAG: DUF1918 domain-containing protein [Acidimicrobiales bacterium]|jgi:hypothetical protein